MITSANTKDGLSATIRWIAAAVLLSLSTWPALAEDVRTAPASTAEVPPVQLAQQEDAKPDEPAKEAEQEQAGDLAPRSQIEREIAKARARMRQDARLYSREQLQEAEALYQVANKQWRSPEARQSLETMIKKYPKFNRTGCAVLYLGQYSEGEDREKYLTRAVKEFSDCFYGNGVQVGAYARYLLAHYYRDKGELEKGNALLKELIEKYPTSITHRGDQLAKIARKNLENPPAAN